MNTEAGDGTLVKNKNREKKFDQDSDVADIVAEIGEKNDTLETLQLDGNSYGVNALSHIGQAVSTCHNVKHLLLNDMFTGRLKDEIPKALGMLLGGITCSNACILTLNLSDNAIGPVTMPTVIQFLSCANFKNLENLYLNNCGLGIKGGDLLATILSSFENLNELVIGRNRLESEGTEFIADAISQNIKTLKRLEIPQNGTKEGGIIALSRAIKLNPKLTVLNLNDNVLTTTAQHLADSIKDLKNLEYLNLGECLLYNEGACIILMALVKLCEKFQDLHLKELILSGNEIGRKSEETISLALKTFLKIKGGHGAKLRVDLSFNNFGESTVERLKRDFGSEIDLIIDADQGSENEDEDGDTNALSLKDCLEDLQNQEDLRATLEKFKLDYENLAQTFFQIATEEYIQAENKFSAKTELKLITITKLAKTIASTSNQNFFVFLDRLLVYGGVMKSEYPLDLKKYTPEASLVAMATISKEFGKEKICIRNLVLKKINESPHLKFLEHEINSQFYKF